MKLNLNAVWSRAVELVRDNFSLLVVIAGVFLLLPTITTYLLIPDVATLLDPAADPEVLAAQISEFVGPLIGVGFLAMIFQFAGYGAMVSLMGEGRPTVGQAIGNGFKMVPSLFVIMILFLIMYLVGALVIMVPISLLAALANAPALSFLAVILIFVFVLYLMTRLSLSMPALALEGSLNPFTAIGRSFKLTSSNQWRILLFWLVLGVLYFIIALLFTGIFGVIAALFSTGMVASLILGLVNGAMGMIVGMLLCAIAVAMYGQLSGPGADEIEQTFE